MRLAISAVLASAIAALFGLGPTLVAGQRAPVVGPGARCFGAASRDPLHPCHNARLDHAVFPDPAHAKGSRNSTCHAVPDGLENLCWAGIPPDRSTATIAIAGDSKAMNWRGAVAYAARTYGWTVLSVARARCPLSTAIRAMRQYRRDGCAGFRRDELAWFRRHREIHTIFVAELAGGSGVLPTHGRTKFETAVAGYLSAWRRLPRSIRRIVVIRDNPQAGGPTRDCVLRAVAAHERPGPTCAIPRRIALHPDPAVAAARHMGAPRVRVIDMTPFFCDSRYCYPVIGGALVFKDTTHLTLPYINSLAPYLLREVRPIFGASRRPERTGASH